jgi:hypothetical protein
MTLIVTVISNCGIIQAADSNLSTDSGEAGSGKKVFHLGFADAVLAVAGAYSVGGQSMEAWMPACIDAYAASDQPTLAGFADYLGHRLGDAATNEERNSGSLIHIAGYVVQDSGAHPEFFFVRNIEHIDRTGEYVGRSPEYNVTEDFWNRDYPKRDTREALASGGLQRYFNGYPPGRIAYLGFSAELHKFLQRVWHHPGWGFRQPRSIEELASIVDLEIRAIGAMFTCSDYPAPYIGGKPQIVRIPPPPNAVAL